MWFNNVYQRGAVLMHPTEDLEDHFALGKELGSGFSGVVRLCVDRKTGERLACKSIRKVNLEDEGDFEDVRLEISVMRRLNHHPNMVGLREVFEDPENVHLILELCEGGDLFDEVVKRGPLSEAGAAQIVYQVAEALATCHAKGVMHRDLKPENILLVRPTGRKDGALTQVGGPGQDGWQAQVGPPHAGFNQLEADMCHVKLADFGLAMFLGPFQEASGFAGSPYYVAPEVLSQTWYGREADIWSLGVVLYVLLSGEFPFAGKDDAKLYKAIKRGKLNFSYAPWPSTSVLAKSLIRSMLALDPRARPTAVEIMQHPWIQTTCFPAAGPQYHPSLSAGLVPRSTLAYLTKTLGRIVSPPRSATLKPTHAAAPPSLGKLSPPEAEPPLTPSHLPQKSPKQGAGDGKADASQASRSHSAGPRAPANQEVAADISEAGANQSSTERAPSGGVPVVSVQPRLPVQGRSQSPPPELPALSLDERAPPPPRPLHKKPNFFLEETAMTMTLPKVLSAPKTFSLSELGSPKSVLQGPLSEEGSDTDSDPGSPSGAQSMATPQPQVSKLTLAPPEVSTSALSGVLAACYSQIAATCTCYSSAILGRCLSRRRPRGDGPNAPAAAAQGAEAAAK